MLIRLLKLDIILKKLIGFMKFNLKKSILENEEKNDRERERKKRIVKQ